MCPPPPCTFIRVNKETRNVYLIWISLVPNLRIQQCLELVLKFGVVAGWWVVFSENKFMLHVFIISPWLFSNKISYVIDRYKWNIIADKYCSILKMIINLICWQHGGHLAQDTNITAFMAEESLIETLGTNCKIR